MRIYWYWPHPHEGASPLALASLRRGDELVVESLATHRGRELETTDIYEVRRDLRDPDPPGVPRIVRSAYPLYASLARASARRQVVRDGFDVAYLHQLHYLTDWRDLRTIGRRVPLVSMVHDVRPHARRMPQRLELAMLKATYQNGGELVVYHEVLRTQLQDSFGLDPTRIHVIPLPMDASDQRDPSVSRADKPLLLLFGVLRPNKGLLTLIEALELLGDDFGGQVVVAGAAPAAYAQRLLDRSRGLLSIDFEFGRISEERKRQLFSSASWVLLPYYDFFSQSAVLLDAYAYRLPVIVSDVGALGATVRSDDTGIVVPPHDPEHLAEALLLAVDRPVDKTDRIKAAAEKHDPGNVGPLLREVYDIAISRA